MGETPARRAARALLRTDRLRGRGAPPVLDELRAFRALVAYDGSAFAGWQRQRDVVSVAEALEAALSVATETEVVLHAAGRTDAGVHADAQAVRFHSATGLPPSALLHLAQQLLPPALRVLHVEDAPPDWNPQRDAIGKLYRYMLLESATESPARERAAWRVPAALDDAAMRAAARSLVGRHDFRAFRNDPGRARRGESTLRTITRLDVGRAWDLVRIDVEGDGFLYMMVRNVTAALVEVGAGRRPPEWVGSVLAARDRRRAPPPAPAAGLTLVRVDYPDGFGSRPAGRYSLGPAVSIDPGPDDPRRRT